MKVSAVEHVTRRLMEMDGIPTSNGGVIAFPSEAKMREHAALVARYTGYAVLAINEYVNYQDSLCASCKPR